MAGKQYEIETSLTSDSDNDIIQLVEQEEMMEAMLKESQATEIMTMSKEQHNNAGTSTVYCDPCKNDGKKLIAEGFCVDCNDYLCKCCFIVHRRPKPCRNHVLQNIEHMPRSKPSSTPSVKRQTCSVHKEQELVYYCEIHNDAFCKTCKQIYHRKCGKDGNVSIMTSELLDKQELEKVQCQLAALRKEFQHNLDVTLKHGDSISTSFDRLITHLTEVKDSDVQMVNELRATCESVTADINSFEDKLKTLTQNDENEKVVTFIALQQTRSEIDSFNKKLSLVRKDNKLFEYAITLSEDSISYGWLGNVFKRAERIACIDIGTTSDRNKGHITGIEIIPNNRIIVADHANNKIKLLDLTAKTPISELELNMCPWGLTCIDDEHIAVTANNKEQILIVTVSDVLREERIIYTGSIRIVGNVFNGIQFNNDQLIVCHKHDEIQFYNQQGALENRFLKKNSDGVEIFSAISYIALGPDKETFYLSDYENNTVLIIDLDGKVVSSFKDENLQNPQGIAVGKNGRVFVCSGVENDHCILEIESDLSGCEIILGQDDGIDSPCSILYNEGESSLFIGDELGEIKVFRV